MLRLAIRVARADAEIALAELLELVPAGVEEVDHGDTIEYAVYGAPGELPALPELRAAAGAALVDVTTTEVADDWAARWREFHRPLTVGGRLYVRPPWHAPPDDHSLVDVVVDPGQAFGTGAHHTTRMCLEALLELEPAGAFMDLGCGSGVLSIAAAKLGWSPVAGVDHERESVAATLDNAAANGVTVAARHADLLRCGPVPTAPTVAANLVRPLLAAVAEAGFDGPPPCALVLSGLLHDEAGAIAAAFERFGLRERARRHSGEWAALTLTRDPCDQPPAAT